MSWSLKKWVFGSGGWTKHNIDFWQPQGVYFLEKCGELSEWVAFGQKLRYFTDQKRPNGGPHENEFWVFSNSEMNITNRKSRWVISLVSMFPSWVMVFKLSKKVLTSARNLSLLKQFTYMNLKYLVTHFQKMVLFIVLWILVFEVKEFC